jgi:hypothetical protein
MSMTRDSGIQQIKGPFQQGIVTESIEKKCYLSVVIEQETTGCVCINITHKNESTDICGCIWFVFNLKSDRLHFG